jgi:DNA polymerase (family 10)
MNNSAIADNFSLLSKLMDIHGDNSFKAKSYSSAAFNIEKLPMQLSSVEQDKIFSLKGIGESVGQKVIEQLNTGKLSALEEYILKTPTGVIEMLNIKGIGPKKISTIWKEMEIESLGELLYACNENRLTLYKGFGEKTQQSVKENIEFYMGTMGSYLYQQIENYALSVHEKLATLFPDESFIITGAFRIQLEIIEKLEWVTTVAPDTLSNFFTTNGFEIVNTEEGYISFCGKENVTMGFYVTDEDYLYNQLFATSCSNEFLQSWIEQTGWDASNSYNSEEEIFEDCNCKFIPSCLREDEAVIEKGLSNNLPDVIQTSSIKGIIHSHSNWSDGNNTLEEMAHACIDRGFEYLVISDHSKTAFYAQGLPVEKVLAQHQLIDELNKKLSPFKIFKSIESDILGDGSLDYEQEILHQFDIVIASIHSNLKMTEEKAMMRLMNAISNPFTSILGHMTGRLLLSRNGYPVNHNTIIEACAKHNVVIELNAHPRRLDIDWRFINQATEKNVLISINPDAHSVEGYADCKYGVLVAQKAGLTEQQNLSSYNLNQFENFVAIQQQKRKA